MVQHGWYASLGKQTVPRSNRGLGTVYSELSWFPAVPLSKFCVVVVIVTIRFVSSQFFFLHHPHFPIASLLFTILLLWLLSQNVNKQQINLIRPVVTTDDPSVSSFPSSSQPCPHLQQQQQQI